MAQGVTYGLVAALAIEVAIGKRGHAEDRAGALQSLADKPGGRFLLGAIAVGLGGYAFWKFTLLLGLTAAGLVAFRLFCLVQGRYREV